jgi:hypothetical protein
MSELYVRGEPQTPKRSIDWKKILIVVGIAYILIIAACLVILILPEPTTYKTNVSTSSAKVSTASAKLKQTANWKVYTNKKLGFSLKYPNSWNYTKESPNATDQEPAGVTIAENNTTGVMSIEIDKGSLLKGENDFLKIQEFSKPNTDISGVIKTRLPDTTVDGLVGYVDKQEYIYSNNAIKYILIASVQKNTDYWEMLFTVPFGNNTDKEFQSRKTTFDLILLTFKFLN